MLSADDSGGFLQNPKEVAQSTADKMHRARESKDQILKKLKKLHFPEKLQS